MECTSDLVIGIPQSQGDPYLVAVSFFPTSRVFLRERRIGETAPGWRADTHLSVVPRIALQEPSRVSTDPHDSGAGGGRPLSQTDFNRFQQSISAMVASNGPHNCSVLRSAPARRWSSFFATRRKLVHVLALERLARSEPEPSHSESGRISESLAAAASSSSLGPSSLAVFRWLARLKLVQVR